MTSNIPPVVKANGFKYFYVSGRYSRAIQHQNHRIYARDYNETEPNDIFDEPNDYEFIMMLEKQNEDH